jgi:hypothetical protein
LTEAFTSFGNHDKGTLTLRPSVRSTLRVDCVTDTFTASGLSASLEVFVPRRKETRLVFGGDLFDFLELVVLEASRARQADGL